jgi:hypothetical protein
MPIHDWTRVPAGLFHDFHQSWTVRLKDALNAGRLPKGVTALVEQRSGAWEPDVLAIENRATAKSLPESGGLATVERPTTQIVRRSSKQIYAGRANRIVVKHHLGRIVAVIEIVSPGNKDSKAAIGDFLNKTLDFLRGGVHVLVADLFPPTRRDPHGIHKLIWDEIEAEDFSFPPGKDRILASYQTGSERTAYVEPIGVGDIMPDIPLFLASELNIKVPLELTYQATWEASPEEMRIAVETGVLPVEEE